MEKHRSLNLYVCDLSLENPPQSAWKSECRKAVKEDPSNGL